VSPAEIHRVRPAVAAGVDAANPDEAGQLELLGRRIISRFGRFSSTPITMWAFANPAESQPPAHPHCREFQDSAVCGQAWELQRRALADRAEPLWHHCPFGRLCGVVPMVWAGQLRGAFRLVGCDCAAEESFTRELDLLDLLTTGTLPLAQAAATERVTPPGPAPRTPANPPADRTVRLHAQVERALAYIAEHLGDSKLSVARIASAVGSHPDYLAHLFCLQTGRRMSRYIASQRIARACGLLARTRWQVKAVAAACGYDNPNWFSHVFHRWVGATPGAFRRAARTGP
jgi:AraC-like DNA-binding protein